jgi:hypothetical protein
MVQSSQGYSRSAGRIRSVPETMAPTCGTRPFDSACQLASPSSLDLVRAVQVRLYPGARQRSATADRGRPAAHCSWLVRSSRIDSWRPGGRFVSRLPEPGASRLALCHCVGVVEQAGHLVVRLKYRTLCGDPSWLGSRATRGGRRNRATGVAVGPGAVVAEDGPPRGERCTTPKSR